ncbi:unnamed protein product, partial [Heterosigma akashiwo]
AFIEEVRSLRETLAPAGKVKTVDDVKSLLLRLCKEKERYEAVVLSLEAVNEESMVVVILQRLKALGIVAQQEAGARKKPGAGGQKVGITCWRCQEDGHLQKDC